MKTIILQVINGNNIERIVLTKGKSTVKKVSPDTKYQLVDENGQLIADIKTTEVGNDLLVVLDEADNTQLILQDYQQYYPIHNTQYLAAQQATFATAESAEMAAELSVLSSTTAASVSVAKVVGIALGSIATVGAGVALSSGGGSSGSSKAVTPSEEPTIPPTPTAPTTPTMPTAPTTPETPVAKPVITLDAIATDDLLDAIEAQNAAVTITGTVENANNGDVVTLTIGEAVVIGTVQNGRFAIAVPTKTLVVHQEITATLANANVDTRAYSVQLPEVTVNDVTLDNIVNIAESKTDITLSGLVNNAPVGSIVNIVIADQTFTAPVMDGKFTLAVSGALLAQYKAFQVFVETPLQLSSPLVTHQYEVDLDAPTPKINLNPITGDNRITTKEAGNEFTTVTGTVEGVEDGQEVIVSCGCLTCADVKWIDLTTQVKNGQFSVDFKTTDLLKANYNIVKATVTAKDLAQNTATVSDSEIYTHPEPLYIDITKVDDFSFNVADIDPLVRIKGAVEFEGDYAVGMNDKRLHQVDVAIGGKVYSAGFHDKQFFIDIPASELEALNGQAVSISFPIASGVWKDQDLHNNVYRLAAKDDGTYTVVMSYGAITPQIKTVTLDSPYLTKDTATGYTVNYQAEPQVEVSGKVIAEPDSPVKVGDKIVVKVGDQSYETTVQVGNVFSVMVDKSALAKVNQVTATLTRVDASGASIQVSDVEHVIGTRAVSGTHVITQATPPATINNDHSTDGYNFPYFIQKLGSVTSAVNTDLGGKDTPLTYTYHFVTAEERAAGIESMRELPIKAGTYVDPDAYHANFKTDIRNAYKEIEKYINVKFVEVDTQAAADTNIYVASFDGGLSGSAAYAWPGYNLVWNGGIAYDRSGLNFPFYTALHEIGHTLGMGHSAPTFTGVFQKEETLEFTNMSYRFGVDNGRYFNLKTLRMFDLAYLHHQFGVNKEARSGNDVYSFKAYNSYAADGDIYIWDGAGVDTFDASKEIQGVNVNLTPGSWIYVGDTREQNLVVKGTKSYTIQEYFGLAADVQVTDNSWIKLGTTTFNEYTKGQAFIGYGTQIENLVGSEFKDTLTGNVADNNIYGGAGNDTIDGGAGNDYLDGGLGDDILVGGLGDDVFVLDSATDAVLELEGEGNDTVYSLANISLEGAANVENVILIGTTATEATGNALDNRLVANDIGNILSGGAGNDRLEGGLGADILTGGDGVDTFVFNTTLNGKVDTMDLQANDKLELSKEIFDALATAGATATDYIKIDGDKLYYDSDNSGVANAVHFATITTGIIALDNNNIVIV